MSRQLDLSNLAYVQRKLISSFLTLSDAQQSVIITVTGVLVENADSVKPLPVDLAEHANPALGLSFVSEGVLYLNLATVLLKAAG